MAKQKYKVNYMQTILCALCKHHSATLKCDECGIKVCQVGAQEHHDLEAHGKGNFKHSSFNRLDGSTLKLMFL